MEQLVLNSIDKILNTKVWLALFISLFLVACSSTDDEDVDKKIAELVDITEKFQPEVLWENGIGNGVEHYFSRLEPIAAYDNLYVASREGDVIAVNPKNGRTVWKKDLSDLDNKRGFWDSKQSALISGGPAAGMGKIFVGSENGKLYALDAKTGDLVWEGKVKGEIIASPAVDSGIVVVNTASGILKAFNATTGEDIWKIEVEVPALSLRGISAPKIASGGVVVGTPAGTLNVYVLDKGQAGWVAEIGGASGSTELERVIDVDVPPLIFGDKIYTVASRGNLAAVDLRSGRILWKRQYSSYRELAISGNTLFLTDVKGHVQAVDRINGLEKWSNVDLTNRNVTGPAVVGNYIVVGDFEGYLHWLDQDTGEIVARLSLDSSGVFTTPTVVDGILYTQSRDGDLAAIKTP